ILAGVGGPTRQAIAYAQEAERLGAKGLLLLPHYLTEASQDGVAAHVEQVCKSVKIGVVVYNRNGCRLTASHLEQLVERCPNLVGYKDGLGDVELMVSIRRRLGDRLAYLGGLPTAEVYAAAYKALGVPVYSSAVFNFIPKTAMRFYEAVSRDDHDTVGKLIDDFFLPYLDIRNRRKGYAVSIVKAGARIAGHDAGPVRAPLTELLPDEYERLAALIEKQGAQGRSIPLLHRQTTRKPPADWWQPRRSAPWQTCNVTTTTSTANGSVATSTRPTSTHPTGPMSSVNTPRPTRHRWTRR